MYYYDQLTGEFGISLQDARMRANTSAPDGSTVIGTLVGYQDGNPPDHNQLTHVAVEVTPKVVGGVLTQQWRIDPLPQEQTAQNLARAREAAWEAIKRERDRRKFLGVKVGTHWFHSDDSSRIQQLALAMMGASIPAGLQWKVLTLTPSPVFVEMTPSLAQAIFQATAASDAAIFAAAETHRVAMEASADPAAYDFSGGWPVSIEDEA